jgi:hypothetical protein
VVPYSAVMPGAPYYAEAFSRLPGRCFRMVAVTPKVALCIARSR